MNNVYRIEGTRLNSKVYFSENDHEYVYTKRTARHGKVYLACSKSYCGATATFDEHDIGAVDEDIIGPTIVGRNLILGLKPHNHLGELTLLPNLALANSCKRRAMAEGNAPFRLIYDEERAR